MSNKIFALLALITLVVISGAAYFFNQPGMITAAAPVAVPAPAVAPASAPDQVAAENPIKIASEPAAADPLQQKANDLYEINSLIKARKFAAAKLKLAVMYGPLTVDERSQTQELINSAETAGWSLEESYSYVASFNCDKATSKAEKMICASPALSQLDKELGLLYSRLISTETYVKTRDAYKTEQENWVKDERDICIKVKCMALSIWQRGEVLREKLDKSKISIGDIPHFASSFGGMESQVGDPDASNTDSQTAVNSDLLRDRYKVPPCSSLESFLQDRTAPVNVTACQVIKPTTDLGPNAQYLKLFQVRGSIHNDRTLGITFQNITKSTPVREISVECKSPDGSVNSENYTVTFGKSEEPIFSHYGLAGSTVNGMIVSPRANFEGRLPIFETSWEAFYVNSKKSNVDIDCSPTSITIASTNEVTKLNDATKEYNVAAQKHNDAYARQQAAKPDPLPALIAAYSGFNQQCMNMFGSSVGDMITQISKQRKYYPGDRGADPSIEAELGIIKSRGCAR